MTCIGISEADREVVDAVNDIFYPLMGQDIGNVGYDAEAALYAGAVFPEYEKPECCKPELLLVPMDGSSVERREQEAFAVAGRIRQMIDAQQIPGLELKDIVILLRSMSGWAEVYQNVFEQEGIPLIVSSKTGYFSASEVQTVLSLLPGVGQSQPGYPSGGGDEVLFWKIHIR